VACTSPECSNSVRVDVDVVHRELTAWVSAHGPVPVMTNSLMTAGGSPLR
jgi:hypothetical protein